MDPQVEKKAQKIGRGDKGAVSGLGNSPPIVPIVGLEAKLSLANQADVDISQNVVKDQI
jgi:hypothetical protein